MGRQEKLSRNTDTADQYNSPTHAAEWDGRAYHRIGSPQFSWGQQVLARLSLRGDETVMDAGCGTGRLTAELLERVPRGRVIAVDNSESMLQVASEHLRARFGDRVSFVRADLQTLQMDEAVDVVFSTAAFHWVTDHPRLFQNLYRALKPGGRLVAQCGGGPNIESLLRRASRLMATAPYAPFFGDWAWPWEFADDVTTTERLRTAGFVDVETSLKAAPTLLDGAQEYREFISNVVFLINLKRLPNERLRDQCVAKLTEMAAVDNPPFLLDYWRLNLRGRRPC